MAGSMNKDAGLETVLEQRRRILETLQMELALRERTVQQETRRQRFREQRVADTRAEIAEAQNVREGGRLDVQRMHDLERGLLVCEDELANQVGRLQAAQLHATSARLEVVQAHQGVRAIELVLENRAAARAEDARRIEGRAADEVAARAHLKNVGDLPR